MSDVIDAAGWFMWMMKDGMKKRVWLFDDVHARQGGYPLRSVELLYFCEHNGGEEDGIVLDGQDDNA